MCSFVVFYMDSLHSNQVSVEAACNTRWPLRMGSDVSRDVNANTLHMHKVHFSTKRREHRHEEFWNIGRQRFGYSGGIICGFPWLMIQPLGGVIVPPMYRRGVPLSVFWKLELTFSQEVTPWNTLPSNISNYDTATEILPVHVLFSLDISGVCLPYHNYDIQGSKSTIMRNIIPVGFYYLWSKIKFFGSNAIRMDMLKTNKALYWCNKDNTKI